MLRAYVERSKQDTWVYAVFVLYTVGVSLLTVYLGEPQKALRGIYIREWLDIPVFAFVGYLTFVGVKSLRSKTPLATYGRGLRHLYSPRVLCGFLTYMVLGLFHGNFTVAKTLMEDLRTFSWDPALADLDAVLHGGDPWQLLPLSRPLTRILQVLYYPVWLFMVSGVSFYVSLSANNDLRRQYFRTFFFCWIVLGNLVALAFLSGGPIYYEAFTGSRRFAALTDYLQFTRGLIFSSVDVSQNLWSIHLIGDSAEGTGISAFPSLHLAMVTLWLVILRRVRRWLQWPMIAYLIAVQIASVHLAWHYAIDGYFSIAATLVAWKLFGSRTEEKVTARDP